MTTRSDFKRQARRTALLTIGLLAALIFGIVVLAGGDWIPGTVIVAASLVGLASQVRVISRLCREAPPAPPDRQGPPTRTSV
jgi:hypothetical protein